jgi:NAD(P)-dependent dehydrogenase (short-subunit alcohol dehydrogenase family)
MNLAGQVVAITGAFGNLGTAIAGAAASSGARVALIDRAPALQRLASELPGALTLGGVDLASLDAATEALDRVQRHFGRLDALINAAGTFRWETLAEGSPDTWAQLFAINAMTAVSTSKAAIPHMLANGRGRIVNVGANAAAKAATGMGAYAASKAAVARLTESLADELKDKGITVNAILPSIIDTPQNRADMPDADFSRWVAPADIAKVILFLISNEASAVTGALIPVTGRV